MLFFSTNFFPEKMETPKNSENKETTNYDLLEKEKLNSELREAIAKVTGANKLKNKETTDSEPSDEKSPEPEV